MPELAQIAIHPQTGVFYAVDKNGNLWIADWKASRSGGDQYIEWKKIHHEFPRR